MKQSYIISTPTNFIKVIEDILNWQNNRSEQPLIITLEGDLGAGKTTFTQVLGQTLGINETITSPTFTIMKRYELDYPPFDRLVHIDAYRFETEAEASPLHLGDIFTSPRTIICIEWPERLPGIIPTFAVQITISIVGDKGEAREAVVQYPA